MKTHSLRRILSAMLALVLVLGCLPPATASEAMTLRWSESDTQAKPAYAFPVAEDTGEPEYQPWDMVRATIVLESRPTIRAGFSTSNIAANAQAKAYREQLRTEQIRLASVISETVLEGKELDVVWNLTLVGNLISANVPYGKLEAIAQLPGVRDVILENRYASCSVQRGSAAQPQMYASLGMTGSTLLWSSGFTGTGSRIAVIDTGTDLSHQSLDNGAYLHALQQNAAAAGMSYNDYVDSLDLLDRHEIAAVLPSLNIYATDPSLTAMDLYRNEKHPFGVNYVDAGSDRLVIDHLSDGQGEHGSHVAGIAAANRYIPRDGVYTDALTAVSMVGVAPDAQLLTMKVFGANSPYDSDYMAAIEDAILLGCDAVNLSLGSSTAGEGQSVYYSELLEYMTQTDTVVVASAGNSSSWPVATNTGYLYSSDVNMDSVGSPGSYNNLLTVASVNNVGGVGEMFRFQDSWIVYQDYGGSAYRKLTGLDTSADKSGTQYEFVFIDGIGNTEDYAGLDLTGKVVFCSRGSLNFAVKANNAVSLGAVATVVYNNESGIFSMDLTGYNYTAPCVSISQEDGYAIRGEAQEQTADGCTYYTGTITVYGSMQVAEGTGSNFVMSDFSSWGVPGDLSLKPEITAPGGDIYSLWGQNPITGGGADQYELMSGTSMAAPHITGMAAVLSQYIREQGLDQQTGISVRKLAQSLLMSTATPIREQDSGGNYYSLLNQGAGLARLDLAASADSCILVTGQNDGKVKAELGDDPNLTGVYTFSFSIHNLTDHSLSYTLEADLFCQDAFDYGDDRLLDRWTTPLGATATFTANGRVIAPGTGDLSHDLNGDGITDVQDANLLLSYLLDTETTLNGNGDVDGDGQITSYDAHLLLNPQEQTAPTVSVPACGSVTVQVRLELDAEARARLDGNYPNGTYVEGFVYAKSVIGPEGKTGTCHSIPMLAFYGNWSDATMFDYCFYGDVNDNGMDRAPYLYSYTGTNGNRLTVDYGDGEAYYFGGNPYAEETTYMPERNALSSVNGSRLLTQEFSLIRTAAEAWITVANAETDEIYYEKSLGPQFSAYYDTHSGMYDYTTQNVKLFWDTTDASGNPLPDGTPVEVTLTAVPEYYVNLDGSLNQRPLGKGITLTTGFTIDNILPEVMDMELVDTTLHVTARDNRHVAAVSLYDSTGTICFTTEIAENPELNAATQITLDLSRQTGTSFLLVVCDYAGNEKSYEITLDLPEPERGRFTAVDYANSRYCSLDDSAVNSVLPAAALASTTRSNIMAAEFVDGYVFEVSDGDQLWVAPDSNLYAFRYLADLDPQNIYDITTFLDLSCNYADGKLYGLFYCNWNSEVTSLLCAIDMETANMEVLGEMPVDVTNLAIDDAGNFYSVGYNSNVLYTYTLTDFENGTLYYVGEVGYYYTTQLNSLAWDHDRDVLIWATSNSILEVDPRTADPRLLGYTEDSYVGLYIRPETWGNRFAPTDQADRVILSHTEARTVAGGSISLQAYVQPWFVTDSTLVWSSSDENVAAVDQNGTVQGISQGSAVITAASALDPAKKASCTVSVITLDRTLNAVIWDETGDVWWSEFSTANLPEYTWLTDTPANDVIASAAMMPDGTLYASTLDPNSLRSALYKVDPHTFQMTRIGYSTDGYTDLAPAPGMPKESLVATYGTNVLLVDVATGDYYDWYALFDYNVVGIAYMGTEAYRDWGFDTWVDWYFIVDTAGYVYLLGFLEQDGSYYYLEHSSTDDGVFAETGITTDMAYFSSLYYDGDFLYYSCFSEQAGNVTLYAIDTTGTRDSYRLGTFADAVWPVGGLFQLNAPPSSSLLGTKPIVRPQAMEQPASVAPLSPTVSKVPAQPDSGGGLTAAPVELHPNEEVGPMDSTEYVSIRLPQASVSGILELRFDPSELEVQSVSCGTAAYAWNVEEGCVKIAFASPHTLPQDSQIATVYFTSKPTGDHIAALRYTQLGKEAVEIPQEFVLHGHSYIPTETAPTCTAWGYVHMVCSCGDSYPGENIPPLGHDMGAWYTHIGATCLAGGEERRECTRCGHCESRETPLASHQFEGGSCTVCGIACLGDVNGDGEVDTTDAYLIVMYYNERMELTQEQLRIADVDGSGEVDTTDAYYIVLYYNERIDSFPADRCTGNPQ